MTVVAPPTVLPNRFACEVCSSFLIRFAAARLKWAGICTWPDRAFSYVCCYKRSCAERNGCEHSDDHEKVLQYTRNQ